MNNLNMKQHSEKNNNNKNSVSFASSGLSVRANYTPRERLFSNTRAMLEKTPLALLPLTFLCSSLMKMEGCKQFFPVCNYLYLQLYLPISNVSILGGDHGCNSESSHIKLCMPKPVFSFSFEKPVGNQHRACRTDIIDLVISFPNNRWTSPSEFM